MTEGRAGINMNILLQDEYDFFHGYRKQQHLEWKAAVELACFTPSGSGKADPAADFLYACLRFWKALAKIRYLATLIQRIRAASDAQKCLDSSN
jgi:hypothetical protein